MHAVKPPGPESVLNGLSGSVILGLLGSAAAPASLGHKLVDAWNALSEGTTRRDALANRVRVAAGRSGEQEWEQMLAALAGEGLLTLSVESKRSRQATWRPLVPGAGLAPDRFDPAGAYVLSRFACIRRLDATLIMECPLGQARIDMHDPRCLALLGFLATPTTQEEFALRCDWMEPASACDLFRFLHLSVALTLASPGGGTSEDQDPGRAQWEFHDLFFHSRSRGGRHADVAGGTYRHLGIWPAAPAVRPAHAGEVIGLARPELAVDIGSRTSLAAVLEVRKSTRIQGLNRLTLGQIGEFLFRCARVRHRYFGRLRNPENTVSERVEMTSRPYPGAGGAYPLELYLTVTACDCLEPGMYHYDPVAHALTCLGPMTEARRTLLQDAAASYGGEATTQLLITIASRFERLSWKYSNMAYSSCLKEAGVLLQSMYLVATEMGLGSCALGYGNAEVFARAAGTDPLREGSIAEFILGTAPA